jgi:polysaccharide biosynthesis protein PslG
MIAALAGTAALLASPAAAGAQDAPVAQAGVGLLAVDARPASPAPPTKTAPMEQPAPEPAPPPRPAAIGLSASLRYLEGDELEDTIDLLRSAGVRYSREDISWATVEARPGTFDWSSFDPVVRESARRGLRLIAIPSDPPEWATGREDRPPTAPAAQARYGQFVRAAIERYGSRGTFWKLNPGVPRVPITLWNIWNEPYQPQFWGNSVPDPVAYAQMYRRTVQAARSADPKARFMLEAETGNNGVPWPQPPYLGEMLRADPGLAKDIDAVSVHPYSGTLSPEVCTPDPLSDGVDTFWRATRFQFCRVRDVREILDTYGARDARIWITELGWSTAPGDKASVSEADQARYVHEAFAQLRRWRVVDGVVFYHYRLTERNPGQGTNFYGFVHADGSPKPAWEALGEEAARGLVAAP